jgi:predicted enzyme related to lactoylglutathione lyase
MPRPNHFDMTAENPERAMNFYKDIFGWKFEKWNGPMEY